MIVSPQQQASSCCPPPYPGRMSRKGFSAWSSLRAPGAPGWVCQQPLLCQPAGSVSPSQSPLFSVTAVLGVTLVSSQGLPRSPFWQSPGLLPSALPSVGWPHPMRKGSAAGEERQGAPGWGGCRWAVPGHLPEQTGPTFSQAQRALCAGHTQPRVQSRRLTFPNTKEAHSQTVLGVARRLNPAGQGPVTHLDG